MPHEQKWFSGNTQMGGWYNSNEPAFDLKMGAKSERLVESHLT